MNKPESQLSQEILGVDIVSDDFVSRRREIEQKTNEVMQNLFYGRVQDLLLGLAEVRRRQREAGKLVDKTQLAIKLGQFFKGLIHQDKEFANEVMRLFQALDYNQRTQDEMLGNEGANLYSMFLEGKFKLKTRDEICNKLHLSAYDQILIFPYTFKPNYLYRHGSVGKFGIDEVNLLTNGIKNTIESGFRDYVLYVESWQNAKDHQPTLDAISIDEISSTMSKINISDEFVENDAIFRGLTLDEYCYLQAHHRINIKKPNDDTDYLDASGVALLLGSVTTKGQYWTGKTLTGDGNRMAFMPYNDFMSDETAPRFAIEVKND